MSGLAVRALTALGIDPRVFACLTRTFILMDLRGQHYARATATQPQHVMSPLFWVVGQCLTFSAAASILLFARVDVRFFALVGITGSMLVMATAMLVEFNEVALDPRDLEVIGHRPIPPRTYAAARFANLLFYFVLLHGALNLFPLLLGAGLRDAGPLYAPAYFLASLAGDLMVTALVVLALSAGGTSGRLAGLKEVLAWTQIVLILVIGYGGQLMLRDEGHRLELWAAFPPGWVRCFPPAWLAGFVDAASFEPGNGVALASLLLLALSAASCAAIFRRLAGYYRAMRSPERRSRVRSMPARRIGGLAAGGLAWMARGPEERVGIWTCRTFLARDPGLRVHCLLPLNLSVAVVVLGILTGQFANPLVERSPAQVLLPILAVYLIPLALPFIIHNLAFSRDGEASWIFSSAPLPSPSAVARGASKAVMALIIAPLSIGLGVTAGIAWGDWRSAALHAALAAALSWPMALASVRLVAPGIPFSIPPARARSMTPAVLPTAALSSAALTLAGAHLLLASSSYFWIAVALVCAGASWYFERRVERTAVVLERNGS